MREIRKVIGGVTIFVVALGLVAVLGVSGGTWYREWVAQESQDRQTDDILKAMGSVDIGSVMSDHKFEYLDRSNVFLSELVTGPTLISFISPTCTSCDDQVRAFARVVAPENQASGFIIISPHNPRFLEDMRDQLGLSVPILYDHKSAYWNRMNIQAYPLNVWVDSSLEVIDILAGGLVESDFEVKVGHLLE